MTPNHTTEAGQRAVLLICCIGAPFVALIAIAVALVPDAYKLPLVGVQIAIVVLLGVALRRALRARRG